MVKLLSISAALFLIVLLAACGADEFPVNYVYVLDIKHSVCSKHLIVDKKKLLFQNPGEEMPLMACDGMIGFAASDFPVARDFIRKELAKPSCQGQIQP